MNHKKKKISMHKNVVARRASALKRLEAQLLAGVKRKGEDTVPLTEKDRSRIEREIQTLTGRI